MKIYAFSGCRLDVNRRELQRDGVLLNLRPKAFDMLDQLIEHRDRVVSKDELMDQVWPGRYISETTLSSCLKELRKALGDSGKEQNIIKTVHGKGFRFIADLEDPVTDQPPQPEICDPQIDAAITETTDQEADRDTVTVSERKTVSVLRCGLVGGADLAQRLGPEAMHYLLQDLFTMTQNIVSRFDGQVTQWLSDGFVALFGVPNAHEDHARRALLAAFDLINRSQCLGEQQQAFIGFGLSSGSTIISALPGNPQQCYTALSDVMQQAEALHSLAHAGQVLISSDSYRLLRADVRVQALEQCDDAWLVEQIVAQRAGVPRRFRRHIAPMVGRNQELSLLEQRLTQAQENHGQAVAIVGNPGIGKSRLLSEFRQSLKHRNIRYLQANCFPHFHDTPFYPLTEYMRQCCHIQDGDNDHDIERKLRTSLEAAELTEADALPLFLKLLELPHDATQLEQLSAQAQRDRTVFYLQRLLLNSDQTTVIALEDMHWLDASSQAWLDALIAQLANQPILLITTCRPGIHPDWLKLPWVSQLALSQLTEEHCLCMLNSLPRAAALQDRLQQIATLSGGNPFFLEELTMNAASSEDAVTPDTIQGVLAARIDQLATDDKKLLQTAAIIGQRGPLKLLKAVSPLAADDMQHALLRLQCAELLFSDFAYGEQTFSFKHALVQDVAYHNQLGDQRRAMHIRIADALNDGFTEFANHHPELLAYHYSEAGHHEQAVRYWHRAARNAYERSAYVETIDCIDQGLALLPKFTHVPERSTHELALYRTLGSAQVAIQGYGASEVERTWAHARKLCETLQDDAALFRVLIGQGNYYLVTGHFSQAFCGHRQLLRLARQADNTSLLLRAKAAMGELMLHMGRIRSAKRYFDHCLAITEDDEQPVLSSQISAIVATCHAAWVYWYLQQDAVAVTYAEQGLQRARALQRPFTLAIALSLNAELQRFRNHPHRALELAQEGVAIAREQAFPYWHGSNLVTLGWAQACIENANQGIETIRRGIKVFRATGARIQLTSWLGALADAHRINADMDAALSTIDEATDWAKKTGDCYYLPQLFQLRDQLLHQRDHSAAA